MRRGSVSARWIAIAVVAVLAVAVVVLSVLALDRSRPDAAAPSAPVPAPTFSLGVDVETPTPTPTPEVTWPASDERLLAIGDGTWWRATVGTCGAAEPLLERSTDGGQSWSDVTPHYRGIGQVSTLDPFAGSEAEMVAGLGDDCVADALRTFTQGRFWEPYPEVLADSTYVDPVNAALVHRPGGAIDAPCADARGLQSRSGTVALVCASTAYVLSADAAWTPLEAPKARAVAATGDAVFVAHASDQCESLAVSRFGTDASAPGTFLGCAEGSSVDAPAALALASADVVVWSGELFSRVPSGN